MREPQHGSSAIAGDSFADHVRASKRPRLTEQQATSDSLQQQEQEQEHSGESGVAGTGQQPPSPLQQQDQQGLAKKYRQTLLSALDKGYIDQATCNRLVNGTLHALFDQTQLFTEDKNLLAKLYEQLVVQAMTQDPVLVHAQQLSSSLVRGPHACLLSCSYPCILSRLLQQCKHECRCAPSSFLSQQADPLMRAG